MVALAALVACLATSQAVASSGSAGQPGCPASARNDALHRRTIGELDGFTGWLAHWHARGIVDELGWPDDRRGDASQWNCLANDYYAHLDAAHVSALSWLTRELQGTGTHSLAVYQSTTPGAPLSTANTQAVVIERHHAVADGWRGVNVSGAEDGFGSTQTLSRTNASPGVYGVDWRYPSSDTFAYLASRGVRTVRLPFRWERIQPTLGDPLDPAELGRLRAAVAAAHRARMTVILDLHNYGGYDVPAGATANRLTLGSPGLPLARLVDVWTRLSAVFHSDPALLYDLMNEPTEIAPAGGHSGQDLWATASDATVRALRARGDSHWVTVGGYNFSQLAGWPRQNPAGPWVHDPLDKVLYEAHHYWDGSHSSVYDQSYADENRALSGG